MTNFYARTNICRYDPKRKEIVPTTRRVRKRHLSIIRAQRSLTLVIGRELDFFFLDIRLMCQETDTMHTYQNRNVRKSYT